MQFYEQKTRLAGISNQDITDDKGVYSLKLRLALITGSTQNRAASPPPVLIESISEMTKSSLFAEPWTRQANTS